MVVKLTRMSKKKEKSYIYVYDISPKHDYLYIITQDGTVGKLTQIGQFGPNGRMIYSQGIADYFIDFPKS